MQSSSTAAARSWWSSSCGTRGKNPPLWCCLVSTDPSVILLFTFVSPAGRIDIRRVLLHFGALSLNHHYQSYECRVSVRPNLESQISNLKSRISNLKSRISNHESDLQTNQSYCGTSIPDHNTGTSNITVDPHVSVVPRVDVVAISNLPSSQATILPYSLLAYSLTTSACRCDTW